MTASHPARQHELADDYSTVLAELASAVRSANLRAALRVNAELVQLYWKLGRTILARQSAQGWGTRVIDRLSADLKGEFPEMSGLSPRNLTYMRQFAGEIPEEFAQQTAAQLPWGHIMVLLDRCQSHDERAFYAYRAIEAGWSRAMLVNQIKSALHNRAGVAPSNFSIALPPADSELAQQIVKDPYNFEFITLAADAKERDLERGLVGSLAETLSELGVGFYYAGRQHRLVVSDEHGNDREFFLD